MHLCCCGTQESLRSTTSWVLEWSSEPKRWAAKSEKTCGVGGGWAWALVVLMGWQLLFF